MNWLKLATASVFAAISLLFAWSVWVRTSDQPPRVTQTIHQPIAAAQMPESASVGVGVLPVLPPASTSVAAASSPFDAYTLLAACALATERASFVLALPLGMDTQALRDVLESENRTDAAACAKFTPTQIAGRLALLEQAVDAHAPGAATAMLHEGPWGDHSALSQRPDDQLVVAWRERVMKVLRTSAEHGDEQAMFSLSQVYEGDSVLGKADQQQAVMYWVATIEVRKARGTHRLPPRTEQLALASMTEGMTPAAKAEAITAGKKLATKGIR